MKVKKKRRGLRVSRLMYVFQTPKILAIDTSDYNIDANKTGHPSETPDHHPVCDM